MKISSKLKKLTIKQDTLSFDLLESGDIYRIYYKDYQVNLLNGNLLDGQISNIYLRVKDQKPYQYFPLIGIKAKTSFKVIDNKVIYQGNIFNTKYQITLTVLRDRWYYDVCINASSDFKKFDVVYGQDVGIAHTGSILSSEAYTAQYIDHSVYEGPHGYVIQSRQNQGAPQFLQLGALDHVDRFATDGFQIFDRSYKVDAKMLGLTDELISEKYQYEFPYISLQSKTFDATTSNTFTFYGYYEPERKEILRSRLDLKHTHQASSEWVEIESNAFKAFEYELLKTEPLDKKYFKKNYKSIRHLEKDLKGQVLSFFTDNHVHIVTDTKERLVERQHGHLLISGDLLSGEEKTFATTNWMFGVFSSHVVLGNTNIQKLTGDLRNPLNLHRISGLRMFIEIDGKDYLLATPNVYEMGINYTRWIYQLKDDQIIITMHVKLNAYVQRLHVKSLNGKTYNFKLINQLVLGDSEYQRDFNLNVTKDSVLITADDNGFVKARYPGLKYKFVSSKDVTFGTDSLLFGEPKGHGMLSFYYQNLSEFTLDTLATYDTFTDEQLDIEKDQMAYTNFINELTGYKFNLKKKRHELEQLEDTLFWYTHNALVHFASPHGLEQSNGAAWGTRDVLQGPVELFMSSNRYDLVRMILLRVFSRQFIETYDFPQWFMFDKYYAIQAHESHGDIIVWPIKVLADYLKATKDFSILDAQVPYMSMETNEWVMHDTTLRQHVDKTLNAIQNSFVKGMSLPAYGGGDWDDTLQPANKKLTDHMVSGWTPLLLYQGLDGLSKVLDGTPLSRRAQTLKNRLKDDYEKHILKDNVPAGFIVVEPDHVDYLLHPRDKNTGLKYRLLPLTRSIISEMVDLEQAQRNYQVIESNLKHPDGVRLMDTFVTYKGGEQTYFQRGETASNVGREIGIMYVHAHIRYIEAMAKLGLAKEAYEAIFKINPINIKQHVKNAQIRQANTYFSSSDAAFLDRYQAKEKFKDVKTGAVEVKAGWRLYSSGPGIYINQLIGNVMGIRFTNDQLVLDPVIPEELKGMTITFKQLGKTITVKYNYKTEITNVKVNGKLYPEFVRKIMDNPYRTSGFSIYKTLFDKFVDDIQIELS